MRMRDLSLHQLYDLQCIYKLVPHRCWKISEYGLKKAIKAKILNYWWWVVLFAVIYVLYKYVHILVVKLCYGKTLIEKLTIFVYTFERSISIFWKASKLNSSNENFSYDVFWNYSTFFIVHSVFVIKLTYFVGKQSQSKT